MLKLHKLFTLFVISILFQPLIAFSLEINGKATYNYTSIGDYELNKEIIRSKAMNLACKDAFKKYVREMDRDTRKNYNRVKSEIENNLDAYLTCDLVVDEQNIKDNQSLRIVVKTNIDTVAIEEIINSGSKIASEDSELTITSLMIVRKATGMDEKFDRTRTVDRNTNINTTTTSSDRSSDADSSFTKEGNKSINTDQIEAVDDSSVISSSNTDTSESGDFQGNSSQRNDSTQTTKNVDTNMRESGGGRIVSAAKYTYTVDDGLEGAIESGMTEELLENNFDLLSLDSIPGVIDLYEEIKIAYSKSNKYDKKLTKKVKDALVNDEVDCYITGSFDVGITQRSPTTGAIMKNVIVKKAVLECYMAKKGKTKKRWRPQATVSGIQAKGEGSDEKEAETNAVRITSNKVGKLLLNKFNAKRLN